MFWFTTDDSTATGNLKTILGDDFDLQDDYDHRMKCFVVRNVPPERREVLAQQATELTGRTHVVIDNGPHRGNRYDILEVPAVGDAVSYGFNGDYYPDGHITHVTAGTLRIIKTDTGSVYYRKKNSGAWVKKGGTWGMVKGHVRKLNPHF